MDKREIKYLTDTISEKERDITCYEQLLLDIMEMTRGNFEQKTLLHFSNSDTDEFVSTFICEIRDNLERVFHKGKYEEREPEKLAVRIAVQTDGKFKELKERIAQSRKELKQLKKHRFCWRRILEKITILFH